MSWPSPGAPYAASLAALVRIPRLVSLLDEFEQTMRDQRWEASRRYASMRTLTVTVSWLGADVPIAEAAVHALAGLDGYMTAKRVCSFLHTRDLLNPDPNRHRDRNQEWIERQITRFPQQIATELRRWILVLRGQGRREHPAAGLPRHPPIPSTFAL